VRDAVGAYVYPIHRIDRGASGIVLFALDKDAHARSPTRGWATRPTSATSRDARPPPEHVVLDHPIPKAPGEDRVEAQTEFWRRDVFGRYALVEARPHTGRLHQIRRHLKHLSCPLIGDVRYGKGEHNGSSAPSTASTASRSTRRSSRSSSRWRRALRRVPARRRYRGGH